MRPKRGPSAPALTACATLACDCPLAQGSPALLRKARLRKAPRHAGECGAIFYESGTLVKSQKDEIFKTTGVSVSIRVRDQWEGQRGLTLSGPASTVEKAREMADKYIRGSAGGPKHLKRSQTPMQRPRGRSTPSAPIGWWNHRATTVSLARPTARGQTKNARGRARANADMVPLLRLAQLRAMMIGGSGTRPLRALGTTGASRANGNITRPPHRRGKRNRVGKCGKRKRLGKRSCNGASRNWLGRAHRRAAGNKTIIRRRRGNMNRGHRRRESDMRRIATHEKKRRINCRMTERGGGNRMMKQRRMNT